MKKELIAITDPKSAVSEMFKTLRTNIQFMNSDKELKTLLVSSTLPGEGKSWTAANLAASFSQTGKKVLLVDADMRKGRQFNIFGVSPTPGLSNYLSGIVDGNINEMTFEDFIQETEVENLYIMTAGNVPPNPAELLVSEKMLELNRIVKEKFDLTIFDGTPSLLVTDAPILSRIVDSTIIVTAHNETKIDNVARVKKAIENVGGKVAGVVVNKIPVSARKYENTYYYGSTTSLTVSDKKSKHNKSSKNDFFWNKEKSETINDEQIEKISHDLEKLEKNMNENIAKNEDNNIVRINYMDSQSHSNTNNNISNISTNESVTDLRKSASDYGIINNSANEDTNANTNTDVTNTKNESNPWEGETQNVIDQVNQYLNDEKNKLRNGD